MSYSTSVYTFNPLAYVTEADLDHLSNLLHDQGLPSRITLSAHRRRGAWGTTLPPGAFEDDLRPNARTPEEHLAARSRVTDAARVALGGLRRPILRTQDVLEHEGALYYHPEALRTYAAHVPHGAFLRALARFLEAAERDHTLIVTKRERRPYVPREERGPVRGPSWTAEEDAVIRRWFGPRTVGPHAGKHASLTEAEWLLVLRDLPRRNKTSVRDRIVVLNRQLQVEFFRDGFVARDRLPQYMARVLGERPRVPIRPAKRRRR